MSTPAAKGFLASRPALAWAFYDWANSAFATTVLAGFFPAFFRQFWSTGAESVQTTFRLGMANATAGLVIAFSAPLCQRCSRLFDLTVGPPALPDRDA